MASPKVSRMTDEALRTKFTISGVDVSFANGLRRAIISHVPAVVFKTAPYSENKATIYKNTIAGINSEYIKERLSGIPIHIKDPEFPIQNYIVECDVENNTDSILQVTTADFKVKNVITGVYLGDIERRNMFPPNKLSDNYILFLELKPRLSETIPGEAIKLACDLSWEESGNNGMYAQVCNCAYGNTVDEATADMVLKNEIENWKKEPGVTMEQLEMQISNWRILDGRRICVPQSFDFMLESVGVYTNRELLRLGCSYITSKLEELKVRIQETGVVRVEKSPTTILNSFDIYLENGEDFTVGNILTYMLYSHYYEPGINSTDSGASNYLSYVGTNQFHPHDPTIVIRVGYKSPQDANFPLIQLSECASKAIVVIKEMQDQFMGKQPQVPQIISPLAPAPVAAAPRKRPAVAKPLKKA